MIFFFVIKLKGHPPIGLLPKFLYFVECTLERNLIFGFQGFRCQQFRVGNKSDNKSGPVTLAGRTFVITNSLKSFTQADAKSKVRALGATIAEPANLYDADFVVIGTGGGLTVEYLAEKAKRLRIKILNEVALKRLIDGLQ